MYLEIIFLEVVHDIQTLPQSAAPLFTQVVLSIRCLSARLKSFLEIDFQPTSKGYLLARKVSLILSL